MIDYLASFVNTDLVAFPNTAAINATGPSTTDGTEFVKLMIDDEWGARQAFINHAGLTPDGVTEAVGTSQFVEALQLGFGGSPGFVQEWNLASTPGVTGHRCLDLNGQGILRANYPELDAAVYVGDGNNAAAAAAGGAYYRADDAAGTIPNVIGIYLIMPESRGVVARGLDTAASIDPDGASRYLGDLQIDAMQRITGTFESLQNGSAGSTTLESFVGAFSSGPDGAVDALMSTSGTIVRQGVDFDSVNSVSPNAAKTDDIETRMYNRSTKFVIWY